MPPAARITDLHNCPLHPPGPLVTGEPTVLIGFVPASRKDDVLVCPSGPPDKVFAGEPSVIIGYRDAARVGDPTVHGGVIAMGCPTVNIGSSPQGVALQTDKPFCEECERKRKKPAEEAG